MVTERDTDILRKVIGYCSRIESKMTGVTVETLATNLDLKEIVCFNLLQIGELAKSLTPELIQNYGVVPWKKIKGMRDWVAHGYGTIDVEIVWETAREHIPVLHSYCELILKESK